MQSNIQLQSPTAVQGNISVSGRAEENHLPSSRGNCHVHRARSEAAQQIWRRGDRRGEDKGMEKKEQQ
ncbi:unnamed protein product [Pleuronectes platessa]|uniref:Uncharacterized protein n=1 Tax=Pleuronectes platessa TaxID=8262 RepID=A0A9N7V1Q2_PLEPL|nr:unnamed protein product [Pleuronectes platessa]